MTPDPSAAAGAIFQRVSALLLEIRQARVALEEAGAAEHGEHAAYLAMLAAFERGLLATLENALAALEGQGGPARTRAEAWLRKQMDWWGGAR